MEPDPIREAFDRATDDAREVGSGSVIASGPPHWPELTLIELSKLMVERERECDLLITEVNRRIVAGNVEMGEGNRRILENGE